MEIPRRSFVLSENKGKERRAFGLHSGHIIEDTRAIWDVENESGSNTYFVYFPTRAAYNVYIWLNTQLRKLT